jgi:hypothetical protein
MIWLFLPKLVHSAYSITGNLNLLRLQVSLSGPAAVIFSSINRISVFYRKILQPF